jgi:hypothetical protein
MKKMKFCNKAIAEGVPGVFFDANHMIAYYIERHVPSLRTKRVPSQIVTHHG